MVLIGGKVLLKVWKIILWFSIMVSLVCAFLVVGHYKKTKENIEVAPSTLDVSITEEVKQKEEIVKSSVVEESIISNPSSSVMIESSVIEEKKEVKKEKKKEKKKSEPKKEELVESSVAPEVSVVSTEPSVTVPAESSVIVEPESSQIEVSKPNENGEAEQSNEKEVSSMSKDDKIRLWEAQNPPPTGKHLTKRGGVFQGPSGKETYYNLKMSGVLKNIVYGHEWKGSLGLDPDEYPYWVRSDGAKMVGPYIMCAAALDVRPYGTILDTSLGKAIVVDTGTFAKTNKKQIDIAVNW